MSSKTPYEIRLELLRLARDHLESTYRSQCEFATQMMSIYNKAGESAIEANLEAMKGLVPKTFSIEDIVAKANELYSFVGKNRP